jgi:S1-C subfamily serine protease
VAAIRPTGAHPTIGLAPNAITDAALRISIDGQDHLYFPGTVVTIGRDPSSTIRLGERHTLVSRQHLRATHRDGSWWLEDLSSKGTWIDHRRVKAAHRAEGAFFVNLGDDDAGTPMKVVAAGHHRSPHTVSTPLLVTMGLAALVPLAALLFVLVRGSDAGPDLDAAKQSTVMLFGLNGGQGSGFFVADDLLVTNQHVAALSPQLLVGVSRQADEPAQIEYATELVENHPFLDIAVLRISDRAQLGDRGPEIETGPVGEVGLPVAEIGDSSSMSIGDQVFSTGFPGRLSITASDNTGVLRLPAVVVTSGQLAQFGLWPGCSNPAMEAFIPAQSPPGVGCSPDGDIDRGVLLSDFRSSEGASGSPVFTNDNLVVGVVYAGSPQDSTASLDIASSAFDDWLSDIIASNP